MSLTKVTYSMIAGAPVNVLDYGADNTDTVDSTLSIQAAIATGKPIYFPAGTYRISGTLTSGGGGWFGDGWSTTSIRCIGDNGGVPFLKPPQQFDGIQIVGSGVGTGLQLGQEYSFTGHMHWSNLRVTNFNLGIRAYNFYTVLWTKVDVMYNTNGVRITPLDGGGTDDGYFTTFQMNSCLIGYGSGYGLWISTPQNTRNFDMFTSVVEGFGTSGPFKGAWTATSYSSGDTVMYNNLLYKASSSAGAGDVPGTAALWVQQAAKGQIILDHANLNAWGLYVEGNNGTPGIYMNDCTVNINDLYMNGTGGVFLGTNAGSLRINTGGGTSATDKFWWEPNANQCYMGVNGGLVKSSEYPSLSTYIGAGEAAQFPSLRLGNAALPSIAKGISQNLAWTKSVSGVTVPANGSVNVISDQYYNAIMGTGAVGMATLTGEYQPQIFGVVTTATTGSRDYFGCTLHNRSASPITLGANARINVLILQNDTTSL